MSFTIRSLSDFKPSELPVGTTIEVVDEGDYIKVDNPTYGIWWESTRCIDCQGAEDFSDSAADERFKEFKIIALPFTVVEYMNHHISVLIEAYCGDFYIQQAIKHHLEPEDTCTHPNGGVLPEGCC